MRKQHDHSRFSDGPPTFHLTGDWTCQPNILQSPHPNSPSLFQALASAFCRDLALSTVRLISLTWQHDASCSLLPTTCSLFLPNTFIIHPRNLPSTLQQQLAARLSVFFHFLPVRTCNHILPHRVYLHPPGTSVWHVAKKVWSPTFTHTQNFRSEKKNSEMWWPVNCFWCGSRSKGGDQKIPELQRVKYATKTHGCNKHSSKPHAIKDSGSPPGSLQRQQNNFFFFPVLLQLRAPRIVLQLLSGSTSFDRLQRPDNLTRVVERVFSLSLAQPCKLLHVGICRRCARNKWCLYVHPHRSECALARLNFWRGWTNGWSHNFELYGWGAILAKSATANSSSRALWEVSTVHILIKVAISL